MFVKVFIEYFYYVKKPFYVKILLNNNLSNMTINKTKEVFSVTISYALLLGAFLLALLQCSVPLVSLYSQRLSWLKWVKPVTWSQFALVTLAILGLAYAFLINDFSFSYVAQNSNTHLPWIYRLCAI